MPPQIGMAQSTMEPSDATAVVERCLVTKTRGDTSFVIPLLYGMPWRTCSFRSSQTLFPEHEQTTLSLSQTPALRAITPTTVSGSSLWNGPSRILDTTILLPIISHTCTGLSRSTFPLPFLSTSTVPKTPRGGLEPWTLCFNDSHMPPVDATPSEMSPASRIVAQYLPGDSPLMVRSTMVRFEDTCTMRARPRILSEGAVECVSNIHTAAPIHRRSQSEQQKALH